MSPSRRNSDQPAESRRPRTRSESRHAEEGEFDISEFTDQLSEKLKGNSAKFLRLILVVHWLPDKPSRKLKGNSKKFPYS